MGDGALSIRALEVSRWCGVAGCLYLWVLNGVCVRNPRGRAQGLRQEGEEWSAQSGSKGEKHGLDGVIPALLAAAHTLRVGVREGTREVRH
jgi:hypothetical protein